VAVSRNDYCEPTESEESNLTFRTQSLEAYQNQISEILRRKMIRDCHRFGSKIGEALVERHKVRARLAVLVHLASAIQNALINMGQAILKNGTLLLRLTSQSFDFLLNNLLLFHQVFPKTAGRTTFI
jgi:hypothetical protein